MPNPPTHQQDTPNISSTSAVLYLESGTTIDAPIEKVWSALTDTSTYPLWNRFIPRATITEQPNATATSPILRQGTRFNFYANLYPEKHETPQPEAKGLNATALRVIEYQPPFTENGDEGGSKNGNRKGRIVWASDPAAGGVISWFLTAERVHEVVEVRDESGRVVTEVRNWEIQVGVLAYVVRWMYGRRLGDCFSVWVEGLKGFVEGQ